MMDLQLLVGDTYARLADMLESQDPAVWDQPSLCAGWRVREVVAHVTMPARMTNEQFGQQMAAVGGDFQRLSDDVAARDADLAIDEHLAHLRSDTLAAWQPPGGGAIGALNHAVVHALDITNAVGLPLPCSPDAARIILDSLTDDNVAERFGVEVDGLRLDAEDMDWSWGSGQQRTTRPAGELISVLCNRTLLT